MKLFEEFKSRSKAEWLAKVKKDLKGKPLDSLNWDYQGFTLSPFYHQEDLSQRHVPMTSHRPNNLWEIGEIIIVKEDAHKEANQQAVTALMRGANALCFEVKNTPSVSEMQVLLKDIQHEWISTHFISQAEDRDQLTANFIEVLKHKNQNAREVRCSFQSRGDQNVDFSQLENTITQLPLATLFIIDTKNGYSEIAQELAAVITEANEILNQIHDTGLDISEHYQKIQFSLEINDDYFPSIAKLRALTNLWYQILQAWDQDIELTANIEVHLSEATQSEDENYNKIKVTTQALSAVIGGATRLYIHPSDQFKNAGGNNFSRRIALNIHHLLQQESYMDRVVDPAAGSYFIEELTDRIGEKAWEIFQNNTI